MHEINFDKHTGSRVKHKGWIKACGTVFLVLTCIASCKWHKQTIKQAYHWTQENQADRLHLACQAAAHSDHWWAQAYRDPSNAAANLQMFEVNGSVPRLRREAKMPVLNCWTKLLLIPPTTHFSLSLLDLFTGQFFFQVMAPVPFSCPATLAHRI